MANVEHTVLNRDFAAGITQEGRRSLNGEHVHAAAHDDRPRVQEFPLHAVPNGLRWLAEHLRDTIGFPVDYTCAGMLFALSVATGTSAAVSPKNGWLEFGSLWLVLVGPPGANKTHPLTWVLRPLHRRDNVSARTFKAKYDERKQALEKKVDEPPSEPVFYQHLISDTTPEALVDTLTNNPRGLGLHRDEVAGWVADFGRYSSGEDAERFLSMWSLQPVCVNRVKSRKPARVERPFVSVCGTIQPGVLGSLVSDGRGVNGFVDRILFAYPERRGVPAWSEAEPDQQASEWWEAVMDRLLAIPTPEDDTPPLVLRFTPDANSLWTEHHARLSSEWDAFNQAGDEGRAGYRTKLLTYTLRFALLDTMARWAEGIDQHLPTQVDATSLTAAIALVDYFASTADRVLFTLNDSTPADRLTDENRRLFNDLPSSFKTAEALQRGRSERTTKRLLNRWIKDGLLARSGQGQYSKRFE